MSDVRRIVEVYLNMDTSREVSSANNNITNPQAIYRGNRLIYRAHLRRNDGTTYYALPATDVEFFFGIDAEFGAGDANAIWHTDDDFNDTDDWGEAAPASGKLCWKVNTNTDAIIAAFAAQTSTKLEAYGGLWMNYGGELTLLAHWPINVYDTAVDYGTSEPTGDSTIGSFLEQFTEDGKLKVRIKYSDGTTAHTWTKE